jgi:hypothetical protein
MAQHPTKRWLCEGCRCRVDAEDDGDWAGSNSSGVVLQLSHTHAMVEYDEVGSGSGPGSTQHSNHRNPYFIMPPMQYDDEHGRKLREQVAVERLQPAYPDGFESGRTIKVRASPSHAHSSTS